jgi:hypothetical protein
VSERQRETDRSVRARQLALSAMSGRTPVRNWSALTTGPQGRPDISPYPGVNASFFEADVQTSTAASPARVTATNQLEPAQSTADSSGHRHNEEAVVRGLPVKAIVIRAISTSRSAGSCWYSPPMKSGWIRPIAWRSGSVRDDRARLGACQSPGVYSGEHMATGGSP